jgi:signal transduction histidine kinase
MARGYWKRFAGSVTGYVHKYQSDLFFRTECKTIALQVLFSGFILVIVAVAFTYLYRDIAISLIEGITKKIVAGTVATLPEADSSILGEVEYIKTQSLLIVTGVVVILTVIFGYIITRITLKPTRDALESQKQFIGNIAHELRTPLATIKTNTEVALLEEGHNTSLAKTLKSNIEELDRVSDIINNLLSLSSFVRPERIEFSNVDLGNILSTVLQKLSTLVNHRQIQVSVRKSDFRLVWGNESALEQVVMNLLKNAIAYTPDGKQIAVTIEPDYRGHIVLVIQDWGIGIAQKDLFRIFEPFYRSEQSRNRQRGGSGLGLTIVNELVKLHHGKISIQSALKRGTVVTVTFPCGENEKKNLPQQSDFGNSGGGGEVAIDFSPGKTTEKKKDADRPLS